MRRPSTKLILKKKRASDTEGYVCIRVGVPGETTPIYHSLSYRIGEKFWDSRSQSVKHSLKGSDHINTDIKSKLSELDNQLLIDNAKGIQHNRKSLLNLINSDKSERGSFIKFWDAHIRDLKTEDKHGQAKVTKGYITHLEIELNRLIKHAGKVSFEDIDKNFLQDYERHMSKSVDRNTTLNNRFKRIKEVIKLATEQELMKTSQIAGYKWPKYKAPERDYLTLEEVEAIGDLVYKGQLKGDYLKVACYFLIECYSGLRFSDWGRFTIEKLSGHRALKVRAKKNGEPVYLHLQYWPGLTKVIEYTEVHKIKFDLPLSKANECLKVIGAKANIDKELSTHIGRHTCATLLGEASWNDTQIAEVLGISTQTVRTYLKSTRRGILNAQQQLGGL